jgi:RNA polymerase sigma factor for flagellar operon FliA
MMNTPAVFSDPILALTVHVSGTLAGATASAAALGLSPADLREQLWTEFFRTRDPGLRQRIASLYLELVQALAAQLASGLPPSVDVNDLVQEGYFGLYRAIGSFDTGFKVKFTTYASTAIRGAMLDSLRRSTWATRGARMGAQRVEDARHRLTQEFGRPPSDDEVAEEMGLEDEDAVQVIAGGRLRTQVPLGHESTGEGTKNGSGKPTLPADERAPDPAAEAQRSDLRELLLKGFDSAERLIVILYYFEQMTMKEIGATLGMSESRVSQKHTLIVERIKVALSNRQGDIL